MSEADIVKRVIADPRRAALSLSVDDILALAARLGALDELAGDVFTLLSRADVLAALKDDKAPLAARQSAAAGIATLIDKIAGQLIALGYDKPKEPEHDEKKDPDAATASAAG